MIAQAWGCITEMARMVHARLCGANPPPFLPSAFAGMLGCSNR